MQARDVFGVAIRLLALWFIYQGLYEILFVFLKDGGVVTTSAVPLAEDKIVAGFHLTIALGLLVFADHIVAMAYGATGRARKPAVSPDA